MEVRREGVRADRGYIDDSNLIFVAMDKQVFFFLKKSYMNNFYSREPIQVLALINIPFYLLSNICIGKKFFSYICALFRIGPTFILFTF